MRRLLLCQSAGSCARLCNDINVRHESFFGGQTIRLRAARAGPVFKTLSTTGQPGINVNCIAPGYMPRTERRAPDPKPRYANHRPHPQGAVHAEDIKG